MNRNQLLRDVRIVFRDEVDEYAGTFNHAFLALEKQPHGGDSEELYRSLMHTAHNLKGASAAAGAPQLSETCHRLESVLGRLRDGEIEPEASLFQLFFETVDAMAAAGQHLAEQGDLEPDMLQSILEGLQARLDTSSNDTEPGSETEVSKESPPVPTSKRARPRAATPASATSIRVGAERIDGLLGHSGELLVEEQQLLEGFHQLEQLQALLEDWKTETADLERPMARLAAELEAGGELDTYRHGRLVQQCAGALTVNAQHLRRLEKSLHLLADRTAAAERRLRRRTHQLDDSVRALRMVPFAHACQGLERTVRDLAADAGKEVDLEIQGGEVELDRSLLERLRAPLLHLVRNAVDHGIELPAERHAAGKAPRASIRVSAAMRGSQVQITVADDGRGLDTEAIRRHASARGLDVPDDDRLLPRLLFEAGFSTAVKVTTVSGRGVGLDVVRDETEALHGRVEVSFEAGLGTRFQLTVPLTLTTIRVLLVRVADQVIAIAGTNVRQLLQLRVGQRRSIEGREVVLWDDTPLPLVPLGRVLALGHATTTNGSGGQTLAVVVAAGAQQMAFAVDELLAEQEVLVKNLGSRLRKLRHIAGTTQLANGRLALILNAAGVIRSALNLDGSGATETDERPQVGKRLLVADDSVTTRTFQKNTLEAAGYTVVAVADGMSAWQQLQDSGADLVISDVEMPRMDGVSLTETIRHSERHGGTPVILLSSRESDADKARGLEAGANAYLTKSSYEPQQLLKNIAQLL